MSGWPFHLGQRAQHPQRRSRLRVQGVSIVPNRPSTYGSPTAIALVGLACTWTGLVAGHVLVHRLMLPVSRLEHELKQVGRGIQATIHLPEVGRTFAGLVAAIGAVLAQYVDHRKTLEAAVRRAEIETELAREQAQFALQFALQATETKEAFLRNLSHELRTPLTGSMGSLTLLSEEPLPSHSRILLEHATQSTHLLASQIDRLLQMADLQKSAVRASSSSLNLEKMAKQVLKRFTEIADDKGVQLRLTIDRAMPRHLSGDAVQLQQVLSLLLDNAFKFTVQGEIEVTVGAKPMPAAPPGSAFWARISVRDTGAGIAPQQLERIFDTFTQADPSLSRRHEGMGLGLAIAKRIVEIQGGIITVESKPGRGSLFVAEVPMTASMQPADAGQTQDVSGTPPGVGPILVVEDNKINQQIVSMLLRKRGYQVELASSGGEALELLENRPYSLVFMDVQMPGMDGLETTTRIRADARWATIPVVAMTAHAMSGDRERCLAAGMNGYISKPFNYDELLMEVRRYVQDPAAPAGSPFESVTSVSNQYAPLRSKQDNPGLSGTIRTAPKEALQRLFVRMAWERIGLSENAAHQHDTLAVSRDSHRLHLASQGMATSETSEITATLERAAQNADWAALLEGLEHLRAQLKRLSEAESRPPRGA